MDLLQDLFIKILNMSLTAGYVILAVLIIRIFIRKLPKRFSYYLWAAVGFRLLCPVSFTSMISFFNIGLFRMDTVENKASVMNYIPSGVGTMSKPQVTVGIPVADQLINTSLPTANPVKSINPVQVILFVGTVLWITGILALLIYSAVSYLRLVKRVSKAVIARDNIYECDTISTPFVLGFFKPRIYIPFRLKEDELEYILRHEQYHIRRLDYLIKPISFLLLIVHWCNPLVWIAYIGMGKDMEMSCDEKVLSEMGASVKDAYSMSLLSFAVNHRFPVASPLAFGETNTKSRIKNIFHFKRPSWWVSAMIGVLCIIFIISFAANPLAKADKNDAVPVSDNKSAVEVSDLAKQLFDAQNPYIGDAPADGTLLKILGIQEKFGDYTLELETEKTPYILRIAFTDEISYQGLNDSRMFKNAALLLALIDNADEIQWSCPTVEHGRKNLITVYYNQQNLDLIGIMDIKSYGETAEKVQELIDILESNNGSGIVSSSMESNYNPDTIRVPGSNSGAASDAGEGSASDSSTVVTTGAQYGSATEGALTMDDVITIKDWSNFNLDYFKSYENATAYDFGDPNALNSYYMFELSYDGKPFELQVSYMKADSSIDMIRLLNKTNSDVILLYSTNPLYKVNTDVTSFLKKNIQMNMYLTYQLPEGFANGPYTATLMAGGNLILKEGEQPTAPGFAPVEWNAPGGVMRIPYDPDNADPTAPQYVIFKDGKLMDGYLGENHTWYTGEPETLDNVQEQAILKEVNHDLYTAAEIGAAEEAGNPIPVEEQTSNMWEIFFAREDGKAAYCLFLNEKYFTKEQAIALAQSVQFTDAAFQ